MQQKRPAIRRCSLIYTRTQKKPSSGVYQTTNKLTKEGQREKSSYRVLGIFRGCKGAQ